MLTFGPCSLYAGPYFLHTTRRLYLTNLLWKVCTVGTMQAYLMNCCRRNLTRNTTLGNDPKKGHLCTKTLLSGRCIKTLINNSSPVSHT